MTCSQPWNAPFTISICVRALKLPGAGWSKPQWLKFLSGFSTVFHWNGQKTTGGFLSHGGTPSYHPLFGIPWNKPTSFFYLATPHGAMGPPPCLCRWDQLRWICQFPLSSWTSDSGALPQLVTGAPALRGTCRAREMDPKMGGYAMKTKVLHWFTIPKSHGNVHETWWFFPFSDEALIQVLSWFRSPMSWNTRKSSEK